MNNTLLWLWRVTGKKKYYIAALTLIQALQGLLSVLYALLFRNFVDSAVSRDAEAFLHNTLLIICLFIVQIGIDAVVRWLHGLAAAEFENLFKQQLTDNILRKNYFYVSATHTAEWLNRLTNDTAVVAGGCVDILPGLVETVVRLISALIMILILQPFFAYILVPGGIIVILLTYVFRKHLKRLHKNIQERDGKLRIFLQEHIGNLMLIKSFAAENQTSLGAAGEMKQHKAAKMKRLLFSNVANTGFAFIMDGMYLACIIYCVRGIFTGTGTYGTLAAVMHLVGQVQGPFANISGYLPRFYAMTASAERLMEIEAAEDDKTPRPASEVQDFYTNSFLSVSLRNAGFSYEAEDNAPAVLNGVSLEIRKGECIAFTGYSGCGKSTVLKLLMCMYPLHEGRCCLTTVQGDTDLDSSWRRLFAYVPQGNALMNGTIREVVSFADPSAAQDEERLQHALKIACADDFVDNADAVLGERGCSLSEGQMQRIAIARAIFADCPILLLDESTSALDEITEARLLENIHSLTDKTVVIVTHRKAALSICDRVLQFTETGVREV